MKAENQNKACMMEAENATAQVRNFEMPECEFCATCGSCRYYEQYGFGKAYCNYHGRDTSSSNYACGYYA